METPGFSPDAPRGEGAPSRMGDWDKSNVQPSETESTTSGVTRRDFIGGLAALAAGAFIGNEVGNLARNSAEAKALKNSREGLTEDEVARAEHLAKALASGIEKYKKELEAKGTNPAEIDKKVKSFVLTTLDTFNNKELVPLIVPSSDSSLIGGGEK